MYGIKIDWNIGCTTHLDDYQTDVHDALIAAGFEMVLWAQLYVCPKPKHTEMLVIHDAIVAMKKLPWMGKIISKVTAFHIDQLGDITGVFKGAE